MNLVTDAWMPVLTPDGVQEWGLGAVCERAGEVVDFASGDALEDAAMMRLLIACASAAAAESVPAHQWVADHAGQFELFDPVRPFGQNADMARFADDPKGPRPIASASYRMTGNDSLARGFTHNEAGIALAPADAARLLLVRQMFSVGGIQSFTSTAYGKAPMSAKAAVCSLRPLLWVQGNTLADTLEMATRGTPVSGTFHFTWPAGAQPAETMVPGGELDALTWPSRSILLLRNASGMVDQAMICDGIRWPEPVKPSKDGEEDEGSKTSKAAKASKIRWTEADDERLHPRTTYTKKTAKKPFISQNVNVVRPVWRQLLTAWATPEMPGLLGTDLPAGTLRLAGLGAYQARIDGAHTGSLPVPAFTREDGNQILETVTEAYRSVSSTAGSLASNMLNSGTEQWAKTTASAATAHFATTFGDIVWDAAAGTITVDEAISAINGHARAAAAPLIDDTARIRPVVAARTLTRPAPKKKAT